MKKILTTLAILPLLLISGTAFAQSSQSQNPTTVLPSGETINKDYFAGNNTVEVSGTVNGDVYVAGGSVLVDGKVNGDLIAAGGTVTVTGEVTQNVRIAGGQIVISGKVGRNVTVAGGNIDLSSSSTVGGSIAVAGGNINVNSPVKLGAKIAGGNVTVASSIGSDLEIFSEQARLTSKAKVSGDFTYWSDNKASVDSGAKVLGKTIKNNPPVHQRNIEPKKMLGVITGIGLFFKLVSLISTFVLGLLFIHLLPKFSKDTLETFRTKTWASLGIGFIALFMTPILAIVLLITVIGIPLALILLPLYFIALYVSRLVVIMWIGQEIYDRTKNKSNDILAFLVGIIVYGILTLIPVIGGFTTFFAILFGLGSALIALRNPSQSVSPVKK